MIISEKSNVEDAQNCENNTSVYEMLVKNTLEWPSLTVSWFEDSKSLNKSKLLLGTHTSNDEPNYFMILNFTSNEKENLKENKFENSSYNLEIESKTNHFGPILRGRNMPNKNKCHIIATKTITGEINIFNKLNLKKKKGPAKPNLVLKGHSKEGYGLVWNFLKEGYLLSGSNDKKVCVWDVNCSSNSDGILYSLKFYQNHIDRVEDVAWSYHKENLFASCGADQSINFYDIRENIALKTIKGHKEGINSIDFNRLNENLFLSGSNDNTVGLWDLRNLKVKLHSFNFHTNGITSVNWCPSKENIFGCSSKDKTVTLFDINNIGKCQSYVEDEAGPVELLFQHKHHSEWVPEFSWCENSDRLLIASVDYKNNIHVWCPKIAESIK